MTDSYVWYDSFICVTWLIHMCDMTHSYVCHDSFICVTWLIHMCDMTQSYVWHDSFICVTWLIHICDRTRSYVWHDSFICVTWLVKKSDIAAPRYRRESDMSHVTHMNESCHTYERVMSHAGVSPSISHRVSDMSHVTQMSHVTRMSHVAPRYRSCRRMYEREHSRQVRSTLTSHVTHMNTFYCFFFFLSF